MAPDVDPAQASPATQVVRLPSCEDVGEAARRLATALAERAPTLRGGAGFFRLEMPTVDVAPLAWLARRPHETRLYFETPTSGFSLAGLGFARSWSDGVEELQRLAERLSSDGDAETLRFLITNRFSGSAAADSPWAAFGDTRVVLPLVELRVENESTTLAVNLDLADGDRAEQLERAVSMLGAYAEPEPETGSFRAICIEDLPDEGGWDEAVNRTLEDIQAGHMAKCVLARTRTYAVDGALDPFALLGQAAREQPDTYRFGIQVAADRSFVGATPEVLFRRKGARVESEALAGTRRRDGDADRDARMGQELLESQKDLEEHEHVRHHIESVLAPLCGGRLDVDGPKLRRLAGVQHLDTRMEGELTGGATDADLLKQLHPTPAVCGVPTPLAEKTIEAREPFDRGLYTGAVGVVGRSEALVTVGIRSALHLGDRITLLAGAGIVKGSDAREEWEETGDKMRVLDAILRAGKVE